MKVKCIQKINPFTGDVDRSNTWLTIGEIYTVLAISANPHQIVHFRLLGNDKYVPALFDSRQFITVCNRIPSNWVTVSSKGRLDIGPEKWLRSGFWEDYFNKTEEAIHEFEEEKTVIMMDTN